MLNSSQTEPSKPKPIPSSIGLTSHHIHSTTCVACRQRTPSQQMAQRVLKTTTRVPAKTFSNPIRHTRTPSHRFVAPHHAPVPPPSRSAAANESRVPDAGSASPWHTPHMHTHMCCTALIPAWPRCTGQHHLHVRSLFVAAIVSVVVGADVSACHRDRQYLVMLL